MPGAGIFKMLAKAAPVVMEYLPKVASATKSVGKGALKAGEIAAKNWKGVTAGVVGWKVFAQGQGLVEVASNAVLGEDGKEKGLFKKLDETLRGDSEKGLGEQVVDTVLGDGATQKIREGVESAGEKISEGAQAAKDSVSEMFHNTSVPMPSMQVPLQDDVQQQQNLYAQQMQSMGTSLGGMFSASNPLTNMLGGMTGGGGFPLKSIAGLVAAAFLMFGRFGWMGKVSSMLLGSLALNNLRQPQQQTAMSYAPFVVQPQPQQEEELSSYVRKGVRL